VQKRDALGPSVKESSLRYGIESWRSRLAPFPESLKRRLGDRRFRLLVEPKSFLVSTQNRLLEGQIEEAATWGRAIAELAAAVTPPERPEVLVR
jgi:hypothetical protein